MTDADPWAAFPDAQVAMPATAPAPAQAAPVPDQVAAPAAAPVAAAADPWAMFPDAATQPDQPGGLGDDHPLTIHGKATPAPDLGAQAAAEHGFIGGVPILGPALLKAEDYIGSRIGSAISGETPDQVSQNAQNIADATDAAHPIASTAGSLAGAVAGTAPVVAAAPTWFGAAPGALTLGKVAMGGLAGGAIGGTDAAVRSGGNLMSTAIGAGGGAIGGAAGPILGAGIQRVAEAGADALARAGALNGMGVSRPAADIITRAAEADGTLGGQGAANIASAGPNGMLADAGPGAQNVLDTAIQRGGPGAVAARQAIEQRAAGADTGLTNALDTTLGQPEGVLTATNAIRDSTAAARHTAYETAYAQPIDYSSAHGQAIEGLVRNQVPAGVIARANNLMRLEGQQSRQILAHVADDGSVTYEQLPDVRQLDYITRSLNDVAQRGDGQGALGGNTGEGRAYGNLSRAIRGQLRQAVPEYATALDTAAEPIQARNALEFGSRMLSSTVPRDEVRETIEGMSASELRSLRQGIRSKMAETLANVKRTITDPNVDARQAMAAVKEFSSDAVHEKLGLILSNRETAALTEALTRATRALELRASIATNSRTAARTMTNEAVKAAAAPGAAGKLMAGEPLNAGKAAAQFFTRTAPSDITRREDEIYGEVARHMTSHRGAQAVAFLNRLQQAHETRAAMNSAARNLPYGVGTQTGMLALLNQTHRHRPK